MKKLVFFTILATALLTSCNVTRKVTTSSSYMQHGDTTVMIRGEIVETYEATKKL